MTRTSQDLGALGEFFGSIAVLVTLIYLAFQTRQNTMAIRAQLDSARIGAVQELLLAAATSTELQEALEEDRVGEVTINQNRRDQWWSVILANMQWQHANQSLLPSAFSEGRGTTIARMFHRYRSMESWWEIAKTGYLPEFVEWIEEQRTKAA